MDYSTVYVINKEADPRTYQYDGRRYRLEPNKKIPVPFAAAALWLGDPRASGNIASVSDEETGAVAWVPDRDSEHRRLVVRYGGEDHYQFPKMEVQDLDGNTVHTVVSDPEGDHVMTVEQTVDEAKAKDDRIAALEAKVNQLLSVMGDNETGNRTEGDSEGGIAPLKMDQNLPGSDEGVANQGGGKSTTNPDPGDDIPGADENPKGKGRPVK